MFDLDGVLIEGEEVWDAVRHELVRARGGHWVPEATAAMMGMSSPEWSRYMAGELGVPRAPAAIVAETIAGVEARYAAALPLVEGAVEVVRELATHWPLGLASSANRPIIELVLDRAGLTGCFRATVSSEEVARGKPAPDVPPRRPGGSGWPRTAVPRWRTRPTACARRPRQAWVVAIPNRRYPPPPELVQAADLVVPELRALTPSAISRLLRN